MHAQLEVEREGEPDYVEAGADVGGGGGHLCGLRSVCEGEKRGREAGVESGERGAY